MSYLGKAPGAPGGVRTVYEFVATAGQTTFSGADRNGATLSYEPGFCDVLVGGVLLSQVDATATSGTSVVIGAALTAGKIVTVVAYGTFKVADALPLAGGTMTGGLTLATDPATSENSTRAASTSWVRNAMAAIATAAGFAILINTNGYVKFPSWLGGLIIQWGTGTVAGSSGNFSATLPIPFPTSALKCVVSPIGDNLSGSVSALSLTVVSGSAIDHTTTNMNAANGTLVGYIAIGN
jgi:hypothetical protein